jgi:hypothetical protein
VSRTQIWTDGVSRAWANYSDTTGKYLGTTVDFIDPDNISIGEDGIYRTINQVSKADSERIGPPVFRRSIPRTTILLGPATGPNDLTIVWKENGVAAPMPSDTYKIHIADSLPAGVTATIFGTPTKDGCTVRVTSTVAIALGVPVDVTALA